MCWSAPASLALGVAGVGVAAYAHKKGESRFFTIPLAYFSLMELLQFASYFYINQCSLTENTTLTFLSIVHMAFQPLFVNMYLFNFEPQLPSLRIRKYIYAASLACTGLILLKLVPFSPQNICTFGTLCGNEWCTVSGNWHMGWSIPQYTFPIPGDSFIYYSIAAFGLPLLYGAWRGVIYIVLMGPVFAYIVSGGNWQEWPAIWCLFSVGFILLGVVRRLIFDKSYKNRLM